MLAKILFGNCFDITNHCEQHHPLNETANEDNSTFQAQNFGLN